MEPDSRHAELLGLLERLERDGGTSNDRNRSLLGVLELREGLEGWVGLPVDSEGGALRIDGRGGEVTVCVPFEDWMGVSGVWIMWVEVVGNGWGYGRRIGQNEPL